MLRRQLEVQMLGFCSLIYHERVNLLVTDAVNWLTREDHYKKIEPSSIANGAVGHTMRALSRSTMTLEKRALMLLLPPRPPTPILPGLLLGGVAAFRLG